MKNNLIKPGVCDFNTEMAVLASAINANPDHPGNGVFVYLGDENTTFSESSLPNNLTITNNTIRNAALGICLDGDCEEIDLCPGGSHTFYYRNVSILNNPTNAATDVGLDLSNQYNVFTDNNIDYNTTGNYAATPVLLPSP